jgi:N-acetylmuramoyl-L-alanine amidase
MRRALILLILGTACTRTVVAPTTAPAPAPVAARPALPPVPAIDGPLAVRVVYPRPDQVVTSRDSNFIFGSIGSGRATLRINGVPVRVYPNGAFLAFLPNPPGPSPRYELVAERGGESVRSTLAIAYPPPREAVAPAPVAPAPAAKPEALATSRAVTFAGR